MKLKTKYMQDLIRRVLHYRMLLAATIFFNIMSMGLAFVFPWLIGAAIDDVIAPVNTGSATPSMDDRLHRLVGLTLIGAVAALLTGIAVYMRGNCTTKLGNRVIADLRVDLFDHLQRLSLHFYSKERIGAIVSCLINDIQQATNLINSGMLMIVIDMIQAAAAIGMLIAISWKLTLASIGILPLYILTFYMFSDRVRIATDNVLQQLGKISGDVQERLAGIATVKTNVGEERERRRFEEATEKYFDYVVEQSHMTNMTVAASEIVLLIGTVIIIGYGSWLSLRRADHLTAGDLTRFLAYVAIMYGPLRRFAELNNVYQSSAAALSRIYGIFYITPEITERRNIVGNRSVQGEVHFKGVKFRYQNNGNGLHLDGPNPDAPDSDEGRKWVLDGLEFDVKARECVALVGPSGSGKSTVVSLLPRLYDVTEGSLCIDNVDVRDYRLGHLRSSIAIVQQDSFLFTGTIRDNLRYGRPNASDKDIVAASIAANAHEFISKLPQGYDSRVGERGVNLSGGQRQRISIARAILKNPRILILDEATSALDTESETLIQAALENLMKDRTSFIVAHRLSTVRNANRILVLDQGRIAESGSHQSLLDQDGLYARLVRESEGKVAPQKELVGAGK